MFRCIEYTAFLWKAKGRHGTHSPFAYWLVDTVRRQKQVTEQLNKVPNAAKNALPFLGKLRFCLPQHPVETSLPKSPSLHAANTNDLAPIYLLSCAQLHFALKQPSFALHPDSILVIYDSGQKENHEYWRAFTLTTTFHFSADCYYFGVLSPKPGQAKQHFYLKLA